MTRLGVVWREPNGGPCRAMADGAEKRMAQPFSTLEDAARALGAGNLIEVRRRPRRVRLAETEHLDDEDRKSVV